MDAEPDGDRPRLPRGRTADGDVTTFTLHVDETEAKPDEHAELLHDGEWNAMENTHMRTAKLAARPSDTRTHVYRYVEPGSATTGDVVFPEPE